jgi:hypothetical protein
MRQQIHSSQAEYERGADRLFATVAAACGSRADFGEQVRSALSASLGLLSSEPALARLLVLQPDQSDGVLLEAHQSWCDRYADLLRRAARSSPEACVQPPFVEPTLIGGVRWQIARKLLAGEAAQLSELAPTLTRYLLCYYLPPERASGAVAVNSA